MIQQKYLNRRQLVHLAVLAVATRHRAMNAERSGTDTLGQKEGIRMSESDSGIFMGVDIKSTRLSALRIAAYGSGPHDEGDFADAAEEYGITVNDVIGKASYDALIIGHTGWSQERLIRVLQKYVSAPLRIFSQELFIETIRTGVDPYDQGSDSVRRAMSSHEVVNFLDQLCPEWETGRIDQVIEKPKAPSTPKEGVLGLMGYHVGATKGRDQRSRREILRNAFKDPFPLHVRQKIHPDHLALWGKPGTQERLQKMASTLASMVSSRQNRRDVRKHAESIGHWNADLEYLRENFYDRLGFDFPWQLTSSFDGHQS